MAIVINGSGTVTGLSVGGLPDGTVDSDTLASGIDKTSISDSGDATAITISSDEKVGIGTGAPAHNLDISPASGDAELKISGAEGQSASIRLFADQGDDADDIKRLLTDTSGNFKIQHYASSAYVDSMVLDSSGNVGIGTASPQTILSLDENTDAIIGLNRETSGDNGGDLQVRAGAGKGSGNSGGDLYLCSGTGTSSASVGKIQFGRSTNDDSTMTPDEVWMTINNTGRTKITTSSGDLGLEVYRPTTSTSGDIFRIYSDIGGTETAVGIIEANGDFLSATNSYGSTSDERIKEQITDANNQWQDVSAIRLRNFKFKNDVAENGDDALLHLGVIAQELEEAGMSGLVSENEDGVKCVKTSIMLLKALGALQEAQTRIETLETKVAALESA